MFSTKQPTLELQTPSHNSLEIRKNSVQTYAFERFYPYLKSVQMYLQEKSTICLMMIRRLLIFLMQISLGQHYSGWLIC